MTIEDLIAEAKKIAYNYDGFFTHDGEKGHVSRVIRALVQELEEK